MEIYLFIIVALVVVDYVIGVTSDLLNVRALVTTVPDEFKEWPPGRA